VRGGRTIYEEMSAMTHIADVTTGTALTKIRVALVEADRFLLRRPVIFQESLTWQAGSDPRVGDRHRQPKPAVARVHHFQSNTNCGQASKRR